MNASKPLVACAPLTRPFGLPHHASTAIATVGALLAAGTAQAGIVYGGDTPTSYTTTPGTPVYSGSTLRVVAGDKTDQLTGSPASFSYSGPLAAGAVFGPSQVIGGIGSPVTPVAGTNYYGFAENIAGPSLSLSDWRYGWIQIDTVLNEFTYAYNDVVGTPIAIGAKTEVAAVPEPAGLALLATGLVGLVATRRRRRSMT